MTAEPGWYPYDGDPPGTMRRWNGHDWIGFPTEMPSQVDGGLLAEPSQFTTVVRPFRNQVRLAPFGVIGAIGLIATIITGGLLLVELLGLLGRVSALPSSRGISQEPFIAERYRYAPSARFGIALFVGGALFVAWVFRAAANIDRKMRKGTSTGESMGLFLGFIFRFYIMIYILFSEVLGVVVRRMFHIISYSGAGKDHAGMSGVVGFFWWFLWSVSAIIGVVVTALLWNSSATSRDAIETMLQIGIVALGAHIVSLVLALQLVYKGTQLQDRRLGL